MTQLWTGESFLIKVGEFFPPTSFFTEIEQAFWVSLIYIVIAGFIALLVGMILGFLTYRKLSSGIWLEWFSTIPDFILIILLQALVIWIFKNTNILLATVININDDPAYLLPIVTLSYVPLIFITRNVRIYVQTEMSKDYVLFAKAKGLTRMRIYTHQVLPNISARVQADLFTISSILVGSLFIIEILFNIYGATSFLIKFSWNYAATVNGLFVLTLIFLLLYALNSLFLYLLTRLGRLL
ncbi:ABC transporter permease subunit [Risungbinella massiliensis]|uniref:ABC transporter permease subunit n=1 Tax=Risungbinella massiliensis TaxID=1329796 RepID=UPI001E501C95|nr:ABC transporter permease subunit [Risungbinella massiliensis]